MLTGLATALAGADVMLAFGLMDGAQTASLAKTLLDADTVNAIERFLRDDPVDEARTVNAIERFLRDDPVDEARAGGRQRRGHGAAARRRVGVSPLVEVLEREEGRSGELVLRRNGADLEVILNGAFLISTANDASRCAMVTAALPHLAGDALEVLIGGLGLGYALDEALANERVAHVTVAEYEPTIVRWFRAYGEGRAERAAAGERAGRATIAVADVANVLAAHPEGFDLVSLDTDNGPDWLVREANAGLYSEAGVQLARRALRPGGAVVFWSPDRYAAFETSLAGVFASVVRVAAFDVVQGRRHEYTMYVGLRDDVSHGVD